MQTCFIPWGHLLLWWAAAILLLRGCSASSSPHSLYFRIAIWESDEEPPQFMGLGFLDDELWAYYDDVKKQSMPRVPWIQQAEVEDHTFWEWHTKRTINLELRFRGNLGMLRKQFNQSNGFLTWQQNCGCELSHEGHIRGFDQYGYNGRDFLNFNLKTLTWVTADARAEAIKREWDTKVVRAQTSKKFLEETCIEWLKKYMRYAKETLLRKEPPIVKVSHKMSSDTLETLTCRAHGFYPKEINATWMKNGKPWEQETSSGSVVPNSDGTYHTWIGIKIKPKDRGLYWCHVEHASLMEPLNLSGKESASVGLIVGAIMGAAAAILLVVGIFRFIKKRQHNYNATSSE